MPLEDQVRLRHILDAATEATRFVKGRTRLELDSNDMLNLALVRLLEIIGEAARGISSELRAAHSEINWTGMAGMRNRLIHGYFDVNLDIVWQTVTADLPPLIKGIEKILAELPK